MKRTLSNLRLAQDRETRLYQKILYLKRRIALMDRIREEKIRRIKNEIDDLKRYIDQIKTT